MAREREIVIFCSASGDIDPKFNQAAREATRAACSLGYTIVSGGTVRGTMGVVADEVVECGGRHIGVLPRFMREYAYPSLTETVWTDTMSERKERMREGTCAALALPGGIGTLDELIETLTLAKLHLYALHACYEAVPGVSGILGIVVAEDLNRVVEKLEVDAFFHSMLNLFLTCRKFFH